jgi:hypothetical protein
MAGLSSLFMSIFFIVPAFSASFSFCVIQVSDVGVLDSFWYSRVIVWVVGLCRFWALVTAFIMSWSCVGSFR